jgi:hypothetical protein
VIADRGKAVLMQAAVTWMPRLAAVVGLTRDALGRETIGESNQ